MTEFEYKMAAINSKKAEHYEKLLPDFVPVPSAEIMRIISIVSLIVGICLVGGGLLFLFLNKKKGKEKKATVLYIFIGVGALLIVNHGIQLLF